MGGKEWDSILKCLVYSYKSELKEIKHSDTVDFCFQNQEIRRIVENYIANFSEKCKSKRKNNNISNEKRIEGNKKYKEKNYLESLQLYTVSIFFACKDGECLSLAYANRSLVLFLLEHFSECLQDIQLALDAGYPSDKKINLLLRKSKCLAKLGEIRKSEEVLNNALKDPQFKSQFSLIQKHIKELKNIKIEKKAEKEGSKLPELAGGKNENFSFASKYLTVRYNDFKGRHVIALQDIEAGDVLFVEKPFAYVIFKKVCHNCCGKLIAPIGCENCLDVSYCSIECRKNFWKSIHSYECGFSKLFETIGIAHLSLRIILATSSSFSKFSNIIEKVSKIKHENGSVSWNGNSYNKMYNLVSNVEKFEITDLFQYAVTALLMGIFLKNYTDYFSKLLNDRDLKIVVHAIWIHILQLICNGYAITDPYAENLTNDTIVDLKEDKIGTAIYTSACMMNHSCDPSVITSFQKNYIIVKALKPIKKGEEVFDCYGPDARRMIRSKRQEILSQQYFFQCKCEACLQPVDLQEKFEAFKCPYCKGPLIPSRENLFKYICLNCGKVSEIDDEILEKNNLFYSLLKEGRNLFPTQPDLALKKFLNSWLLGREIFYKFNKSLTEAADEVAKCLAISRDFRRSLMFLKCTLLCVKECFGSSSIELAHELIKFCDIITMYCINCEEKDERKAKAAEGLEACRKFQEIITLVYGPDHEEMGVVQTYLYILQDYLNR